LSTTARFLVFWDRPNDPEAFDRHYREVHIPLARKLPGLRSYVITDDQVAVRGEAFYRIAELHWDSMEDLRASITSPEGQAVADDVNVMTEKYAACRNMVLGPAEEVL